MILMLEILRSHKPTICSSFVVVGRGTRALNPLITGYRKTVCGEGIIIASFKQPDVFASSGWNGGRKEANTYRRRA